MAIPRFRSINPIKKKKVKDPLKGISMTPIIRDKKGRASFMAQFKGNSSYFGKRIKKPSS